MQNTEGTSPREGSAARTGRHSGAPGAELALDMHSEAVTLFARTGTARWREVISVPLDSSELSRELGELRVAALVHGGKDASVTLWLPPDQILVRRAKLAETQPLRRMAEARAVLAGDTVYDDAELAVAVSPPDADGWSTILATLLTTTEEARVYARRWGLEPGIVSTRSEAAAFGTAIPEFAPRPSAARRAARAGGRLGLWLGLGGGAAAATWAAVAWLPAMMIAEPQALFTDAPGRPITQVVAMLPDIAPADAGAPVHAAAPGAPLIRPETAAPLRVASEPPLLLLAAYAPASTAGTADEGSALQIGAAPDPAAASPPAPAMPAGPAGPAARPATPSADPAPPEALAEAAPVALAEAAPRTAPGSLVPVGPDVSPAEPPLEEAEGDGALASLAPEAAPLPAARPGSAAPEAAPADAPAEALAETAPEPSPLALEEAPVPVPAPARTTARAPAAAGASLVAAAPEPEPEPAPAPEATVDSLATISEPLPFEPDTATRFAALIAPEPPARPAELAAQFVPELVPEPEATVTPDRGSNRDAVPTGTRTVSLDMNAASLVGIINSESGRRALVRLPGGDFRRLARGDRLDGWQVSMIGLDAMRLTQGGREITLPLVAR